MKKWNDKTKGKTNINGFDTKEMAFLCVVSLSCPFCPFLLQNTIIQWVPHNCAHAHMELTIINTQQTHGNTTPTTTSWWCTCSHSTHQSLFYAKWSLSGLQDCHGCCTTEPSSLGFFDRSHEEIVITSVMSVLFCGAADDGFCQVENVGNEKANIDQVWLAAFDCLCLLINTSIHSMTAWLMLPPGTWWWLCFHSLPKSVIYLSLQP